MKRRDLIAKLEDGRVDVMRRAYRFHWAPGLRLPQYPDYLLFAESTSFHGFLLSFSSSRSPVLSRPLFRDQVITTSRI